ncbi:ATP synthase F1 subunit epsilon [Micavibrio aeruginosavorus]|uniref:ATP synthase epsilon chain n=1 Tax=Micavibrio aeruginosavorus EPB TaxID=349215 RepID=M4VW47_9BACT|nr:ATP synthase F1 subunit epsilon [Micavibrio aeruginosavorus]AGH97419.1 ATP synthase epsilon chain [Micavibrio aeruginosavorus EPB]
MADATTSNDVLTFELVSPERKLMSGTAYRVTIPGVEGDFGVLAGHASVLSTVRMGVVEILESASAAPVRIFITGGFADVTPVNCTLLAEEAVNVNDLDAAKLEQDIRNLGEDLAVAKDTFEKFKIQRRLEVARAKLKAVAA